MKAQLILKDGKQLPPTANVDRILLTLDNGDRFHIVARDDGAFGIAGEGDRPVSYGNDERRARVRLADD